MIVIRPQWPELERFLQKSGKFLPVTDLGLQPATDKVVCLAGVVTSPKLGGNGMRVIAKSSLIKFWSQPEFSDSKGALQSWFDEAIKAD